MPSKVQRHRQLAFVRQHGRCHYCGCPMWSKHPDEVAWLVDAPPGVVARLRCTAEHLRARCDGGDDDASNIVATRRRSSG
ncbi:MAG: hypothetical protein J0L91_01265 [Burkholderiales bacterium]|nr:hypothetical protein [Burkholderiales bacterium]